MGRASCEWLVLVVELTPSVLQTCSSLFYVSIEQSAWTNRLQSQGIVCTRSSEEEH